MTGNNLEQNFGGDIFANRAECTKVQILTVDFVCTDSDLRTRHKFCSVGLPAGVTILPSLTFCVR